ncbi:MAG: PAS domain S-box protein [Deltaproteobacteria bacterium]|nr:PAS domain S-box protein [Deltaproteobacteria bacterium]
MVKQSANTDRDHRKETPATDRKQHHDSVEGIADLIPGGLFRCDPQLKITYLSPQGLRMFGFESQQLANNFRIPDLVTPDDREDIEKFFDRVLTARRPLNQESTGLQQDGVRVPLLMRACPVLSSGKVIAFQGTLFDISRLKTSEKLIGILQNMGFALGLTRDLKESMGQVLKFACQVEGIDAGCIYTIDPLTDGMKISCHRGLPACFAETSSFYDFASQQTRLVMTGKPIYDDHPKIDIAMPALTIGSEDRLACRAIIPMRQDGQVIAALFLYGRRKICLLESARSALETIGNRMAAIISRFRAVEALWENESKYRLLLDTMNEGFMIVDEELTLTYANQKLCGLWGYQIDEIIGLPISYFLDEKNKKILLLQHEKALRGETTSFEITWTGSSGQAVPTIASPRTVYDGESHFRGYCTVLTDITELREAWNTIRIREEDLKIKSTKLEEMNAALKILLKERNEDRTQIEEKILSNVRQHVDPLLEKFKVSGLNPRQRVFLDLLEASLKDLLSPFTLKLSSPSLGLTATELQVAHLLRDGRSTKEIAEILNLSARTIDSHRLRIRKKIGINHKTENLSSRLQAM